LHASFTIPQLKAYLLHHVSVKDLKQQGLNRSMFRKESIVHAIINGLWKLPSENEAQRDLELQDPLMTRVNAIPDNAIGTFNIPCTERDLFFVHGHGETVRRLMLQGNVSIDLELEKKEIIIKGSGTGIKKTVNGIRELLVCFRYDELFPICVNCPAGPAVCDVLIELIRLDIQRSHCRYSCRSQANISELCHYYSNHS
jgi:hypothetical protein